jgi:hypothetical protein
MIGALINSGQFNTQGINGTSVAQDITASLKVIYNQTGIELNWSSVDNALAYFVEVSLYADFRTIFESATVNQSMYSFTDAEPSGQKRYWRWAPTIDGVTKFLPWSEVGSYWLDTALSAELELNRNEWAFADPDDMLDNYGIENFPTSMFVKRNLYRSQERNRLGELLSEFLTIKDLVTLNFNGAQYMHIQDLSELERFHNDKRTFFLACFKDGQRASPMPHVWLVQCVTDPSFNMIAAGRHDLLAGQIQFEEV